MKQFFAPISKINKKTREVHGILALEVRDKEGEIMDYALSKPLFEKWSRGIQEASGGKSVGNLRYMHQNEVPGKFTGIIFNDEKKQVEVVAKVSDDKRWQQVLDGELNGFSVYGNYASRKRDRALKAIRYAVDPLEGSLVDNPCMYGANFTLIKEDGNEIVAKFSSENKKPYQSWHCRKDCDILHLTEEEATNCNSIVAKSFDDIEEKVEDDFTNRVGPLEGDDMKLKVKKVAGKEEADNDELELDDDAITAIANAVAKPVAKMVAKSVGASAGEVIKETIVEALEEQSETIEAIKKAVFKLAGTPKPSGVKVQKVAKKKSDDENEKEEEENPKKVKKTSDIEDPELHKAMKMAMRKPMRVVSADEDDEEETPEDEDEE